MTELHKDLSTSPPAETAPGEEKPYHSKRPHRKSRAGCKNCKARKVKCDEARPSCRSCRLRKTSCVYPTTTAAPPPASAQQPYNSPAPSSKTSEPPLGETPTTPSSSLVLSPKGSQAGYDAIATPPAESSLQVVSEPLFRPPQAHDDLDMRLLWFYTAATSTSFSVECGFDQTVEQLMRTRIVAYGFKTPFLMQTLFALSSLHLQTINQNVDPSRALAYRVNSFEGYRRAVQEANPETFPSLICNSLFMTALSSHNFRDQDGKDLYILDWMVVWRGIGLMISLLGVDKLVDIGLHVLFYRPPMDLDEVAQSIPNQLLFMVSSISADDVDYPHMQTYYSTLKYLGSLYHYLRDGLNPTMNLRIVTWLTFVEKEFVDLARMRRPRALVILAHYAIFLKLAQSMWWLSGIGQRTIQDICTYLGHEWSLFIKSPTLAIGMDDNLELCRLILGDPNWVSPPWDDRKRQELLRDIVDIAWVNDEGRKVHKDDPTAGPGAMVKAGHRFS